jgi:tRNA threonylcarbamoyladenosine modification (KEOPS) complex  Pcc1 subunit
LEAEITVQYEDEKTARAVANAVSPDNVRTPSDLSIATARQEKRVITSIKSHGKLPTFIATIDDLLFSVSVAEKALQATKNLK